MLRCSSDIAAILVLSFAFAVAAEQKSSRTALIVAVPHADVQISVASPAAASRTPGPMITPGAPIENRITIVPFPPPGVTSATEIELYRTMNVPRAGRFQLLATTPGPRTHSDPAGAPARIPLH